MDIKNHLTDYCHFLVCLFLLTACALLTACGKETELTKNALPKGQQEVVIAAVAITDAEYVNTVMYDLNVFIQQYNESQSNYVVRLEIIPVEPSSVGVDGRPTYSSDDIAKATQRLNIELVTGTGGYDLLWLDDQILSNIDVQGLLKAGVLEDLGKWLDKKGGLKRDDFFDIVLSAYNLDGTIFALPAEVCVRCLSGNSDLLGARTEWTLREFLDFAAEYPDMKIHNCWYPGYAALTLFQEGNISFVQKNENGQLIFDDKLLGDLIEYAKNGPSRQGELGIKLAYVCLNTAREYRCLDPAPKTFIGFPSQDGQNGCIVENKRSFSICSNSDSKEGAWAFLEYYLLHNEDNRNDENNFRPNRSTYPALKEVFENRMAEELYIQWVRDENGEILLDEEGNPQQRMKTAESNGYVYPPFTEEDVALVRDFLLSPRGAHLQLITTNQLSVILSEECIPYYLDQKPLDDVVEIIKRRMISFYQEQDI